jgi:hypothetical protein
VPSNTLRKNSASARKISSFHLSLIKCRNGEKKFKRYLRVMSLISAFFSSNADDGGNRFLGDTGSPTILKVKKTRKTAVRKNVFLNLLKPSGNFTYHEV